MANNPLRNSDGLGAGFATNDLNASAILEARSTSKGFLVPRMTETQRDAIATPLKSLLIFNSDSESFEYYNGTTWVAFGGGSTPTLQEVLDYNHDLVDGNFFAGTFAGQSQTGENAILIGDQAGDHQSGNGVNALGNIAGSHQSGNGVNAFGFAAGFEQEGDNVNAFGSAAGASNTFNDVNLFGSQSQADGDFQTVFSKDSDVMARFDFSALTGIRKITFPDSDVTIGGGSISLAGEAYLSLAGSVLTANPIDLSGTNVTGSLPNTSVSGLGTLATQNGTFTDKLDKNTSITAATKTKITYDAKGLVTSGADATTADIADSTNKRYQTDNQNTRNDATSSIQTQLDAKKNKLYTFNRQPASYTLVLTDADNKIVEMNVGSANNLTIPLNSTVAFPIGSEIPISQYGAGQTTIVATGGVTLRSANNWLKINAQYGAVSLVKVDTDEWYVWGNLNA